MRWLRNSCGLTFVIVRSIIVLVVCFSFCNEVIEYEEG